MTQYDIVQGTNRSSPGLRSPTDDAFRNLVSEHPASTWPRFRCSIGHVLVWTAVPCQNTPLPTAWEKRVSLGPRLQNWPKKKKNRRSRGNPCSGTASFVSAVVLTLGSHTGKLRLLSSGCFNKTGFGHSLEDEKEKAFKYISAKTCRGGAGSSPFGKHQEELVDQSGCHGIWIQLARPGHQHGPRHSTQKPQHVGVDPSTCRHASAPWSTSWEEQRGTNLPEPTTSYYPLQRVTNDAQFKQMKKATLAYLHGVEHPSLYQSVDYSFFSVCACKNQNAISDLRKRQHPDPLWKGTESCGRYTPQLWRIGKTDTVATDRAEWI